jgi:hypothetical protein
MASLHLRTRNIVTVIVVCVVCLTMIYSNILLHRIKDNQDYSSSGTILNADMPTSTELQNQLIATRKDLEACKQVHRLKLVLIDTKETHENVRMLVGSIHKFHQGNIKIYIYGLNLPDYLQDEILLWEYVTFFDIEKEFITSSKADQPPEHLDERLWRSVVIYDALDRAGKVLFLSSDILLQRPLPDLIFDNIEKNGAYFASLNLSRNYENDPELMSDSFVSEHHSANIQGYALGSFAYKHFLVPYIECARRDCSPDELYMLNVDWRKKQVGYNEKISMNINGLPNSFKKLHNVKDKDSQCYIINREDFIHSYKQLPGAPKASCIEGDGCPIAKAKGKIIIALGFPSTSKGNNNPSLHNIPFVKVFLNSLIPTIESEKDKFHFVLYMGYDEGDVFYDVPENRQQLRRLVAEKVTGLSVELKMIRVVNSNGWVPFIWNVLFQHAVDDGCEYFYQLNDDIKFKSSGWASAFVNTLKNSPVGTNVGATGPMDHGNVNILTQAFVHKTHYDIFGFLYPYVFRNWYSDDWITRVYEDIGGLLRRKDIFVQNMQSFGTRYHICYNNKMLATALKWGRERIKKWRSSHSLT